MNDCKLMIVENIIKKKINIINNYETNKELYDKYKILYETSHSKVILLNFDKEIEKKINLYIKKILQVNKTIWNSVKIFNKKPTSRNIYNNSLIRTVYFENNTILENFDEYIVNLAIFYLTKITFNIFKEGYVEYRHFNLSNSEKDSIYFDVYKDDENLNYNVETCIFITQNNNKICGNIDFYKIMNPKITTKNTKNEIKIDNNLVILISGNLLYCPQPLYGKGIRNIIIVRLRSNRI